jgi:hypothetical protein
MCRTEQDGDASNAEWRTAIDSDAVTLSLIPGCRTHTHLTATSARRMTEQRGAAYRLALPPFISKQAYQASKGKAIARGLSKEREKDFNLNGVGKRDLAETKRPEVALKERTEFCGKGDPHSEKRKCGNQISHLLSCIYHAAASSGLPVFRAIIHFNSEPQFYGKLTVPLNYT